MLENYKVCEVCGATYRRPKNTLNKVWKDRHTCSKACDIIRRRQIAMADRPKKKCPICGNFFEKPLRESNALWQRRKTCSVVCGRLQKGITDKGRTPWNKGLTKETDGRVAESSRKAAIANKGNPKLTCKRNKMSEEAVVKSITTRHERGYFKPSNADEAWYKALDDAGIQYEKQVLMERYVVDTLIDDCIVVEIDGHWHRISKEVIERDKRKEDYLLSKGYNLLRFTDIEIKKSPASCIELVSLMMKEVNK